MKAFVLGTVGTRSGLTETLTAVRSDKNIEEAYLIWGPYEVVSKVTADSLSHLNHILDIMREHGVVDTNTLIVNEGGLSFEKENCATRRKCAYIFIKMKRPSAPKLWEKYLRSIDEILEGHELF